MEKTWRWFGPKDRITLQMLRQIGVEGIVTALHHIPNGEIWSPGEIAKLKDFIEAADLRWSVVESLPVSESIKYAGADRDALIENYKVSLANLGKAGVKTVCYNFMPVIDWIRTDINHKNPDGTYSLHFDKVKFAYFDMHILKREGAEADYDAALKAKVAEFAKTVTEADRAELIDSIIIRTQGFVSGNFSESDNDPVSKFKALLALYKGIDKAQLRANMKYFLERVIPVAEEYGVNMCVHPDDPPFPVLGLPRIITCEDDVDWMLKAVDRHANGITFCTGSLSAGVHNDVPRLAAKYSDRTHFLHLRSTEVAPDGNFTEANHLEGRANVIKVVQIFLKEEERRRKAGMADSNIPFRVDHGVLMLDDIGKEGFNAGYSFLGRMKGLGEVSGVISAVTECLKGC